MEKTIWHRQEGSSLWVEAGRPRSNLGLYNLGTERRAGRCLASIGKAFPLN